MSLKFDTESPDSLQTLIKKVNAIITVNNESLQFIELRRGEKVILKNKISLSAKEYHVKREKLTHEDGSETNVRNDEEVLHIINKQITQGVDDVIEVWKYQGQPLKREPIAFEDFLCLKLETYEDFSRLNADFTVLAEKYARLLTDQPETREATRCLLDNVETLQIAIGEVHSQVLDTKNPLEDNESVRQQINIMSEALNVLQQDIPDLDLECFISRPEVMNNEGPSIFDLSAMSCQAELREESRAYFTALESPITALESCKINDGYGLAVGHENGYIRLWGLESKTILHTLTQHSSQVSALAAYSLKGSQTMASGSLDKTIKLWNLRNGTLMKSINVCNSEVKSLAVVNINKKTTLISGYDNGAIKMHDFEDFSCLAVLRDHSSCVNSLVVYQLHNEHYLASGSDDRTIKIWSLNDRRLLVRLAGHGYGNKSIKFAQHKTTSYLISSDDRGSILIWNLESNKCVRKLNVAIRSNLEVIYWKNEPHLVFFHYGLFRVGECKILSLTGEEVKTISNMNSAERELNNIFVKVFMNGSKVCIALGYNGHIGLVMERFSFGG